MSPLLVGLQRRECTVCSPLWGCDWLGLATDGTRINTRQEAFFAIRAGRDSLSFTLAFLVGSRETALHIPDESFYLRRALFLALATDWGDSLVLYPSGFNRATI